MIIEKVEKVGGTFEDWVTIDRGNGEFTSMLKETYDAQQAASTLASELSNPSTPQAGE